MWRRRSQTPARSTVPFEGFSTWFLDAIRAGGAAKPSLELASNPSRRRPSTEPSAPRPLGRRTLVLLGPRSLGRVGGQDRSDFLAGMRVASSDRPARAAKAVQGLYDLASRSLLTQPLGRLEDANRLDVRLVFLHLLCQDRLVVVQ